MTDDSKCDMRLCQKFLLSKIEGLEKESAAKFEAIEEATRLNAEIVTKRFESVNEFRAAMNDLTKTFATAKEANILFDKLDENIKKQEEDINSLQLFRAELSGKASQSQANWALFIAIVGMLFGILHIVMALIK